MSGIICWICLTSAISALQLAPLQWQNELNKDQEKNVSQPNRDPWYWEICCGRRSIGETWETVTTRLFKRGLWLILVFSRVEKWSCGARSIRETWVNFLEYIAKSWPSSWRTSSRRKCAFRKVRREDSLSVHHQEQAYSENFVMGSDAAEFVNKVKDQVRNRQKRMSNVAESGEEHSIIWWMFIYNVKCGDIHGKEFLNYSKVLSRIMKISRWNKCSISQRNWWTIRKKSMVWTKFSGKSILWHVCHWLVMKQSSPTHKSLCLLGFYVVSREGSSTSRIQLGRTVLQGSNPEEAAEIMMLSMEPTEFEWNIFPSFTTLQL